jgi:uncharacterized protein YuzE
MKKIHYSPDVDALLIELNNNPIAYAEEEGETILHYSKDDQLVLIEILDFRSSLSEKTIQELVESTSNRKSMNMEIGTLNYEKITFGND